MAGAAREVQGVASLCSADPSAPESRGRENGWPLNCDRARNPRIYSIIRQCLDLSRANPKNLRGSPVFQSHLPRIELARSVRLELVRPRTAYPDRSLLCATGRDAVVHGTVASPPRQCPIGGSCNTGARAAREGSPDPLASRFIGDSPRSAQLCPRRTGNHRIRSRGARSSAGVEGTGSGGTYPTARRPATSRCR